MSTYSIVVAYVIYFLAVRSYAPWYYMLPSVFFSRPTPPLTYMHPPRPYATLPLLASPVFSVSSCVAPKTLFYYFDKCIVNYQLLERRFWLQLP
jgi:hypothetical protein